MAGRTQMAAITIGGKGSSLSSTSIFLVAHKLAQVRIDSSILEKLSLSNQKSPPSIKYQLSFPQFLSLDEIRASATLLLSKLLLSSSPVRADIPNSICQTLNSDLEAEPSCFSFGVIDVTEEEKYMLDNCLSVSALDGICALLDHGASCLTPLAESMAALSCEASKAKISAFNLVDSGDGKCLKDEASVASDLKVLLNGSKLIGKVELDSVSRIPKVYGSFREAVRMVHARARVELNSGIEGEIGGTGKAWEPALSSLASALRNFGESGLNRVGLNASSVGSDELQSSLRCLIDEKCPTKQALREAFMLVSKAIVEEEYVQFVHNVNKLLGLVMTVVSWEMITAVVSLEGCDLLEKDEQVAANGANAKVDKKNDKKKKVFGKGTAAVLQLIRDRLQGMRGDANLQKLAENLCSVLDIRVPAFGDFLEKIKEIVESNESRRLPKLPKVIILLISRFYLISYTWYYLMSTHY